MRKGIEEYDRRHGWRGPITNKFKNLWFSPYGTYKIMAKTSGPYIISIIIPSSKKSNMINGFWKISHRFLSTKNSGILSKDIYKKFSKTYSGKNGFIPDLSNNQINLDNCYMDYLEMESVRLKETKLNYSFI